MYPHNRIRLAMKANHNLYRNVKEVRSLYLLRALVTDLLGVVLDASTLVFISGENNKELK